MKPHNQIFLILADSFPEIKSPCLNGMNRYLNGCVRSYYFAALGTHGPNRTKIDLENEHFVKEARLKNHAYALIFQSAT